MLSTGGEVIAKNLGNLPSFIGVRIMANARMELVCALRDGMVVTARWKDVQIVAAVMDNVKPIMRVSGNVNVTQDGRE